MHTERIEEAAIRRRIGGSPEGWSQMLKSLDYYFEAWLHGLLENEDTETETD